MQDLFLVGGGIAALYLGAESLVRGSASLALRLGLTSLVVGLTVVAFGTSSPEFVVSMQAALQGRGDIAIGNVVGSNICNIALILGLSAMIRPLRVHHQLVRLDVPLMIGCSMLLTLCLYDGEIGRLEGLFLTIGIAGYTTFAIVLARKEQAAAEVQSNSSQDSEKRGGIGFDLAMVAGGLGLLVLGAGWLVDGAVSISYDMGLTEAFVSLTIIAVGTSLPELSTSIVAAFRKEGDIAIGNAVGSNIFNILGILGSSALVQPLEIDEIAMLDLIVMTGLAVLMMPLMRTGFQLVRWEGALLIGLYVGYVLHLLY